MLKRAIVLSSAAALVSLCVPASAADVFSLSSTTFKDGTLLPTKAANANTTYGIDAKVTGFAEGELSKPSDKFVGGKATQGTGIYNGPCTPPNVQPHHYTFVLIATDYDVKDIPAGLTREEVLPKLAPVQGQPNHVKGSAGIVGLFVKPAN